MNPIDSLENKDLLQFFHCHKTEMACMENPRIFLSQLRDHNLVPEDRYQKMSRMKSKGALKNALYGFLDWLEKERPERINTFWKAAFKEVTVERYPTLRRLHCSLMEETLHRGNKAEQEARNERRQKELSESEDEEETNASPGKRKKRKVKGSTCEEEKEKQRKPLCGETPVGRRRSSKVQMSTPLKKGEKSDIWMWPLYKVQLPVTCGEQEGVLDRNRMAKGEKCIMHNKRWFTPSQFETFVGKESCRKWKETIRCMNTPLGKLIQEGHLKWVRSTERTVKAKKSLFAASVVITDDEDESGREKSDPDTQSSTSEEELDDEAAQEPVLSDVSNTVFKVTCGTKFGALHKERFASGTCGKCIRTETSWITPVEFVEEALGPKDTAWRRDIQWEGKPIADLLKANILMIHSLVCNCVQCKPNDDELENQRNDDECWICKSREDCLVECDECPRSFHQKCHLPHVEDAICKDKSQWLCTFCVFKTNWEWFRKHEKSREEAMSCNISEHMLQCHYLLLRLCSADEHVVAANSSHSSENESFSAVYKEIRTLLSIVGDKLQGRFYLTVGEFVSNFELVLTTCTSPHQDAALIAMGNRLKKMFDEEFKNVFFIV